MQSLKTLRIRNCRGIVSLDLPLDGKSLIIKGENGTGKSSIIDAVEFLFDGCVQRFEGIQQLSQRKHIPHVQSSPDDFGVSCTFSNDEEFSRALTDDPQPPASLAEYFDGLETQFILRRAELLTFVNARPSELYDRVAELLGIGHFDNIELSLKRAADSVRGQYDSLLATVNKSQKETVALAGIPEYDAVALLKTLNEKIISLGHPELADLNAFVQWALTPDNEQTSALYGHLAQADMIIQNLSFSREEIEKFKRLKTLLTELSNDAQKWMSQMDFLRKGEEILKDHNEGTCPLCTQPIQKESTLTLVQDRLKVLAGLTEKASLTRTLREELKKTLAQKVSDAGKFIPLLAESQMTAPSNVLNETLAAHQKFLKDAEKIGQQGDFGDCDKYNAEISRIHEDIKKKLISLSATEMIRFIQIAGHVSKLSDTLPSLQETEARTHLSEQIQIAFSQAKKESIDAVLVQIQGLLRQYYQRIHPDEDHRNLTISQVVTRRASLALTIDSYGTNGEDPRALSSEGHLDTLGLCIFLAFVKQFQSGCTLLILDDILTTVDAPHRKLIAKLLFEEFSDKQLIITTHDRVWYQQLVKLQETYGQQSHFINSRIVRWTPEAGPQLEPYKDTWSQIEQRLAEGNHSQAGNLARQYAENICKTICEELETPLFHPEGTYPLRDLWVGAKNRISSKLPDGEFRTSILQIFKDVEEDLHLSNLLSHDNILSLEISNAEIETFCNKLHVLDGTTRCACCKASLKYFRELSQWRCASHNCTQPTTVATRR